MAYSRECLTDGVICLRLTGETEPDPAKGWVKGYRFDICLTGGQADGIRVGTCDLRAGHNEMTHYAGNIGYGIYAPYRGNRYAARACLLLFRLAGELGMTWLYITCEPDNIASRKTCEYAGCTLEEITERPKEHPLYREGKKIACIYRKDLTGEKLCPPGTI